MPRARNVTVSLHYEQHGHRLLVMGVLGKKHRGAGRLTPDCHMAPPQERKNKVAEQHDDAATAHVQGSRAVYEEARSSG